MDKRAYDFLDSAQVKLLHADEESLLRSAVEDLIGAVAELAKLADGVNDVGSAGACHICRRHQCAHPHHRHGVAGFCRDCSCGEFLRDAEPTHAC